MILLTPMDIHNKEFKHSFRGYDEDDVDDYLDRIVNDYGMLVRENEKLKSDLERSRKDNEQYQKLEKNLKDTLLVAQKTADEVTTNAKENAEKMLKNTAQECQNMRREAELKAKTTLDTAEANVRTLTQDYNRLLHEKKMFLKKVRDMMGQELSGIDATIENLPQEMPNVLQETAEPAEAKKEEAIEATPQAKTQPAAAVQQTIASPAQIAAQVAAANAEKAEDKPAQEKEKTVNGRVVEKEIRI